MSRGDHISGVSVTGSGNQIGSGGNTYYGTVPADADRETTRAADSGPVHVLYAFADIVGYSKLNARLQALSTRDLVDFLDLGAAEAGVEPDQVDAQNQGDARFLTFPVGTDPAAVLAKLPQRMDDQLAARNQDMAPHARLRIRMAFAMGASMPGAAGRVGQAPIAVARLINSRVIRRAMQAPLQARCGVIIDSYLYEQCVQQRFRADLDPDDWVSVRVSVPAKDFKAMAWIKLFGYSGEQVRDLLA